MRRDPWHASILPDSSDDLPDLTEAQADAMGFEAARRQYHKELFISGADELPEPEGSLDGAGISGICSLPTSFRCRKTDGAAHNLPGVRRCAPRG